MKKAAEVKVTRRRKVRKTWTRRWKAEDILLHLLRAQIERSGPGVIVLDVKQLQSARKAGKLDIVCAGDRIVAAIKGSAK